MKKKGNFFWISYSDLMTSMFFIMLLLFVLSSVGYKTKINDYNKIKELRLEIKQLNKNYFKEDSINKRWILKGNIQFTSAKAVIKDKYKPYLIKVGLYLKGFINHLNSMKENPQYKNMNISYLVIIEGMSSKASYKYNDALSYLRAFALYNLWKENGISFEKSQCEVQIAGSGIRGIGRYNADNKHPELEYKNQRFIIQIIPKIGTLK